MKGIMFSQDLIPKVLDQTKTVTRRTGGLKKVNENPDDWYFIGSRPGDFVFGNSVTGQTLFLKCPYGSVGTQLYVKEIWKPDQTFKRGGIAHLGIHWDEAFIWKAGNPDQRGPWRSPRFMPEQASRCIIELTGVRAERLQDITNEDAKAEDT